MDYINGRPSRPKSIGQAWKNLCEMQAIINTLKIRIKDLEGNLSAAGTSYIRGYDEAMNRKQTNA